MFLTLEDPRAQVSGSRDPLGAQVLWTSFGRHLIGNLTTVTTSVPSFTVLLLGRYFGERLVEEERVGEEDVLDVFLRWEQVAGYVRHLVHGVRGDIRGIDRIRRRLRDYADDGKVPIGTSEDEQILADQKTYGLWGLYSVAARVSGLLPDGAVGVTPEARHFLEQERLPRLGRAREDLLRLLENGGWLPIRANAPLVRAVAALLEPGLSEGEVVFYGRTLRDGEGPTPGAASGLSPGPGRQRSLAALFERTLDLESWIGRAEVQAVFEAARTEDEALAHRLRRVLDLEALLAPAEALFEHAIVRNGRDVDSLGREVEERWGAGLPHLDPAAWADLLSEVQGLVGDDLASVLSSTHEHLRAGAFAAALSDLLQWNALVMEGRGGVPWVRIEKGRLDVHQTVVETLLPDREDLPLLWRNTYFFNALRLVTRQVREARV